MISDEKSRLRAELLAAQERLDPELLAGADSRIAENLFRRPEYRAAKVIYSYWSVGREVSTRRIIARALADGKTVALPVTERGGRMHPRRLSDPDALVPGLYGIPVPPESEPDMDEKEIDLIIVPAVAFDADGYRLGRGGGYYDRLLDRTDACTAGLARSCQMLPHVPREAHDLPVSLVITD